jgi:hypothetical protein
MTTHYKDLPDKQLARAQQAYLLLIGCAAQRATITYGDLAKRMGYREKGGGAGFLAQFLWPLFYWAKENDLPRLGCLVVEANTGEVASEIAARFTNADRERVFAFNWYAIQPPTIEELKRVWAKAPQDPDWVPMQRRKA